MSKNNILKNREFIIEGGWNEPLKKLKSYPSVIYADHMETSSSAGDWTGLFFQKIGRFTYIIPFEQVNRYPRSGFTLYTGEVWGQYKGKVTREDIDRAIQEYCNLYY
jgi:hypothetical protein